MDFLSSLCLDTEDFLYELRNSWLSHQEYSYNQTAFTRVKVSGDNIMFCCPYHVETNPSCGIMSRPPYSWNCFGCGSSGDLIKLISYVMGFSSELKCVQFLLRKHFTVSAVERPKIDIEELLSSNLKHEVEDEELKKYRGIIHPYIRKRGFSDGTLRKYEVGYDVEKDAITFPVRASTGQVRFVQRRFVSSKGFLNLRNVYKKDILYGLYYILQTRKRFTEIYLTESIIDTMSCYEGGLPAGAIMGRILFPEQVKELVAAGIKTVNLFFDNDKYGKDCVMSSQALILKLSPIRVNVVTYPDCSSKDANDLLLAERMRDISVMPFTEYTLIK